MGTRRARYGADPGERLHGPTARVHVVGVVRGLTDLSAATQSLTVAANQSKVTGGPALAQLTAGVGQFTGVAIDARDDDGKSAAAAIERAFPDRPISIFPGIGNEVEPIQEAIRYEARAAMAFGAIAAIAGLVFVGQAVARQSRREWADLATLRALGMSDRDVRLGAGGRGALTGGAAALVAAINAVALSPFGPIGVGRRAEVDPGLALDATVLVAGTVGVLLVVTLASCLPVLRRLRNPASRRRAGGSACAARCPRPPSPGSA